MKKIKGLFLATIISALPAFTGQVLAVDLIHPITLSLKISSQGTNSTRGDITTLRINSIRVTTKDFINAIGELKDITFNATAKLYYIRRNVELGEDYDTDAIIIRQTGLADCDVSENFQFESEDELISGTVNNVTEKVRTSSLSLGLLTLSIPDLVLIQLSGITTEKRGSQVINTNLTVEALQSLNAKMAGHGTDLELYGEVQGQGGGYGYFDNENLLIVEGTVTAGPGKVVPSVIQP